MMEEQFLHLSNKVDELLASQSRLEVALREFVAAQTMRNRMIDDNWAKLIEEVDDIDCRVKSLETDNATWTERWKWVVVLVSAVSSVGGGTIVSIAQWLIQSMPK